MEDLGETKGELKKERSIRQKVIGQERGFLEREIAAKLEEEKRDLAAKFEEKERDFAAKLGEKEQDVVARMKKHELDVKKSMTDLLVENEDLKTKVSRLEKRVTDLLVKNENFKTQASGLERRVEEVNREERSFRDEWTDWNGGLCSYNTSTETHSSVEDMEQAYAATEHEVGIAKNETAAEKERATRLTQEVQNLSNACADLRVQVSYRNTTLAEKNERPSSLQLTLSQHKARITFLETTGTCQQHSIDYLRKTVKDLRAEYQDVCNKNNNLNAEHQDLKAKYQNVCN